MNRGRFCPRTWDHRIGPDERRIGAYCAWASPDRVFGRFAVGNAAHPRGCAWPTVLAVVLAQDSRSTATVNKFLKAVVRSLLGPEVEKLVHADGFLLARDK